MYVCICTNTHNKYTKTYALDRKKRNWEQTSQNMIRQKIRKTKTGKGEKESRDASASSRSRGHRSVSGRSFEVSHPALLHSHAHTRRPGCRPLCTIPLLLPSADDGIPTSDYWRGGGGLWSLPPSLHRLSPQPQRDRGTRRRKEKGVKARRSRRWRRDEGGRGEMK